MKVRDFSSDLTIRSKSSDRVAPKVSIILPTYARAQTTLSTAVESVLSQSFGDFELIIVDDGSRDGTADVLSEYARVDDRIILHSYHRNSGLPALRVNQAALRSRGNYIGYQFDDDVWTEDSLQVRMSELERADQLAVVYGNSEVSFSPDEGRKSIALGRPFNFAELVRQNFIANNTVLHHRGLFDVAGMYDPHVIVRRYSDYDLWLRFSRYAKFIWVDQTVSLVNANLDNSLGREVRHFYTLLKKIMSTHRGGVLAPSKIDNYDVVDVTLFADRLTEREIETYRRHIAIPFLSGFNDYCTDDELSVAASLRGRRLNLMTIKPDFSTSVDVTINNFVNLPFQRALANTFVPEWDLPAVDLKSMDIAILYRTVGGHASAMVDRREIPTVYCMDDNMLNFHEVGAEHHFLAPGTMAHKGIVQQISESDACIGYGDFIVDDLRELNSRTIQLTTNIPRKFVQARDYQRGEKLRIAILSGPGRTQILAELWPALAEFADRHTDKVEMHFWGIDPSSLGALSCETHFKPFDHNYQSYQRSLLGTSFDVVLVPLDHSTRAARSKSPIKLLEAVAAGAICIFSDAEPYSILPDNCCLKASNTIEAWSAALEAAFSMGSEGRKERLERARSLVIEKYTTEGQFYDFLAAYKSVRLHASLRDNVIIFGFHEAALGGATLHLLHHARIAHSLGFKVVGVVCDNAGYLEDFKARWDDLTARAPLIVVEWPLGFALTSTGVMVERSATERDRVAANLIVEKLQDINVGLLHFATWSPTMSLVGKALNVPSVASVHQFYGGVTPSVVEFVDAIHCSSLAHGEKWERVAKSPVRRIVCPAGDEYFRAFEANRRRVCSRSKPLRVLISGTLQPRKNQLAVIRAIERLRQQGHDVAADFIGYTEFDPEYVSDCRKVIADCNLDENVKLHGFVEDPLVFYNRADLLLVAAVDESMPQTIIQAMACGVPVASTNVGGVKEILRHRYTGLLISGQGPDEIASTVLEWLLLPAEQCLEMVDRAQRVANFLARSSYVKFELIDLYCEAFRRSGRTKQNSPQLAEAGSNPLSPSVTTTVQEIEEIKQYVTKYFRSTENSHPCEDLRGAPYIEYIMPLKVDDLQMVSLVVGASDCFAMGTIGIEIVTRSQEIVAHEVLTVQLSNEDTPIHFLLPIPVKELEEGWSLRVFTRGADAAISVYEIKRRGIGLEKGLFNLPLVRLLSSQARAVQN